MNCPVFIYRNLAENDFPVLPTEGLLNLRKLKTFHNNALQEPINPSDLPNVQILVLSYAYHCCNFRKITRQEQSPEVKSSEVKEQVLWVSQEDLTWENGLFVHSNDTIIPAIPDPIYDDYKYNPPMFSDDFGADYDIIPEEPTSVDTIVKKRPPITCDPQPENKHANAGINDIPFLNLFMKKLLHIEPIHQSITRNMILDVVLLDFHDMEVTFWEKKSFLPCDDLFGWWSLRCGIWIVFLLAVVGNCIVLFVSITARSKMSMDVPRFLVCNLACADLFMGIYLGMLAIVDASSLGSFQRYAINGRPVQDALQAGFLGVISSELSVFTLTVITVERFYAISNALHFNKRLTLRQAGIIMSIGWMFCILNASLPFFGISDYRKFAICLPFETSDRASLGEKILLNLTVCFLMLFNGASFLIIVLCYIKMYCSIMGSNAWNSKDFRIAKRMAILVFTDFLCWAPIIFFTVTSALGLPLIGLNEAKVLTIFVLPLNSCANPFLYAIFTKQFKRDCVKLCKRIEESSISRSLSNMNSRRVSFGSSWRHSQLHSPFHLEKRSSISNSVSGSSVNGNPNNDRVFNGNDAKACSKDCNQFFGRDFDNMEDADEKTPSRLEDKQTDSDKYGAVNRGICLSELQGLIHR
ncbi:hypothetical protein FSP39_021739 [Pinctada imbricata]|uniref:G-protein coupled receptors family 1 profile domain-containing protein n=1 Tax=Pinctada imbricata TaxID=66713 RepID=A0AA89C7B0_PINIB|nr:hypothetical protein FSP39_021739 [Pinctada imbricata]